jgi:hypothetical protein
MLAINRLQHLEDDYKATINSRSYKVIAQHCGCLALGDYARTAVCGGDSISKIRKDLLLRSCISTIPSAAARLRCRRSACAYRTRVVRHKPAAAGCCRSLPHAVHCHCWSGQQQHAGIMQHSRLTASGMQNCTTGTTCHAASPGLGGTWALRFFRMDYQHCSKRYPGSSIKS